jgi:hypothetical protein|tara:strand:+ start:357 stop:767 length:411 start_codon:yes stop_codon:yes gene_type:complete
MDGLFDVKHGISIRGNEYGFVGITNDEIDKRIDDMLAFIEIFDGSAGGTFGEEMEVCIDFPHETLTIEKFMKFENTYREKYPTFDGHLYLHDLNHFTADESKVLDSYVNFPEDIDSEREFEDDEDDEDAERWKDGG